MDSAPSSPRVAAVSSVRQCGSLSDYFAGARNCSAENMLGHGSAVVQESMLGHGSAVRKICWGTEVQYEKYAGSRNCSTKNMLGHGSAVRKICWVTGRPPRLARRAALVAPSPAGLLGCCALPCPSLISIHTPPFSRGRTFVLGLAKRLASSRRSSLPRSPLSPSPSLSLSLLSLSLSLCCC